MVIQKHSLKKKDVAFGKVLPSRILQVSRLDLFALSVVLRLGSLKRVKTSVLGVVDVANVDFDSANNDGGLNVI